MIKKFLRKKNFGLGIKGRIEENPLINAFYRRFINPRRMRLPSVALDSILSPESRRVSLCLTPHQSWDTGYDDLVALCALSVAAKPARILEVGTCRGRATIQLAVNNPKASIVTYDIDPNAGEYFLNEPMTSRIELRIADFAADRSRLLEESKYDFIFIDGSHEEESVSKDSALALEIVSTNGIIAWHDYSNTGAIFGYNAVPEVLSELSSTRRIVGIPGTNLAVSTGDAM